MRKIIGIAGLIGSGKDTVANHLINEHNFQRIKFADKLKDGVSAIFDWPRDLLEGDTDESREWRETPDEFLFTIHDKEKWDVALKAIGIESGMLSTMGGTA